MCDNKCNKCNQCNPCDNKCKQEECGCKFEVDTACIRYTKNNLECIGEPKGTVLEDILEAMDKKICKVTSDGINGNYVQVAAEPPGKSCINGGSKITLHNGETDEVISVNYVCTPECDCEESTPLVSSRMWFGEYETPEIKTWMSKDPMLTDYNSSLTHTVTTGTGLYEIYIETNIDVTPTKTSLSTIALTINGVPPTIPVNVQGENLDNFSFSSIVVTTKTAPTTLRLYKNLAQGDTVVPDLMVDSISSGASTKMTWLKMIIKKV